MRRQDMWPHGVPHTNTIFIHVCQSTHIRVRLPVMNLIRFHDGQWCCGCWNWSTLLVNQCSLTEKETSSCKLEETS